jgi:hypothetical protein
MPDEAMDNAKGLRIGKDEEHEGAIETILDFQKEPVKAGTLLLLLLLLVLFLLLFVLWHFLLQILALI